MRGARAHHLDGDTPSEELVRTQDQALLGSERPSIGDLAAADADATDLLVNPDVRAPGTQGGLVDPAWGTPAQQWAATAELLAGVGRVRIGTIGRRSGQWTVEYRGRDERRLTNLLPSKPAAVRVYGHDGACSTLCLDLDVGRGGLDAVERDAVDLVRWLTECGARVIEDVSPAGGRHIYLPLAERLIQPEAQELVEAIALRFATVDAGPHRSARSGCIRTPGSRHKTGGHQALLTPLAAAVDVLHRRNGPDVVEALRIRLEPQIAAWHASRQPTDLATAVDDPATPSAIARGLSPAMTRIAREGIYDTARYGRSEARAAVLVAAARAGWSLADVTVRVEDGRWPGLAGLIQSRDSRSRSWRTFLTDEWRSARTLVANTPRTARDSRGMRYVLRSNTSLPKSLAGGPPPRLDSHAEHQFVRSWQTAVLAYEQHRFPALLKLRWLLRALAEYAHKTGSRYVGVGSRSLAIAVGSDHTTVAASLKLLQEAGWVDLIEAAYGTEADLYELKLPRDVQASELRWHAGKVHAKRPAFRELGDVAGLVFEALEQGRASTITELVMATGCARSAVSAAVDVLTAYGLVERAEGALLPHPGRLARAAEELGVTEAIALQMATYAHQRRAWRAYLSRHADPEKEVLTENDVYDPDRDEYWLPPPEDSSWSLAHLLTP